MNGDKTYEPMKIEIEVGRDVNPLTIADGLIHHLAHIYGSEFGVSIENELYMYEDIRMIGEALLSVYRAYERRTEAREKYRR